MEKAKKSHEQSNTIDPKVWDEIKRLKKIWPEDFSFLPVGGAHPNHLRQLIKQNYQKMNSYLKTQLNTVLPLLQGQRNSFDTTIIQTNYELIKEFSLLEVKRSINSIVKLGNGYGVLSDKIEAAIEAGNEEAHIKKLLEENNLTPEKIKYERFIEHALWLKQRMKDNKEENFELLTREYKAIDGKYIIDDRINMKELRQQAREKNVTYRLTVLKNYGVAKTEITKAKEEGFSFPELEQKLEDIAPKQPDSE